MQLTNEVFRKNIYPKIIISDLCRDENYVTALVQIS